MKKFLNFLFAPLFALAFLAGCVFGFIKACRNASIKGKDDV